LAVATPWPAAPPAAPDRRPPSCAGPARNLVQGCAAARAWSSALRFCLKGRAGWRIGLPCARRVAPTAGRTAALLRRERLQSCCGAWRRCLPRHSHLRAQRPAVLAVKRGGVPLSVLGADNLGFGSTVFIETPGGDRPGQSPAEWKPGAARHGATGAGRTQWLVAPAGRGAGALSGGLVQLDSAWPGALRLELGRRAARALR